MLLNNFNSFILNTCNNNLMGGIRGGSTSGFILSSEIKKSFVGVFVYDDWMGLEKIGWENWLWP